MLASNSRAITWSQFLVSIVVILTNHLSLVTAFMTSSQVMMIARRHKLNSHSSYTDMPMGPPSATSGAFSLFSLVSEHRSKQLTQSTKSAIPVAGVHDALSAKIFAQHKAPALFLSGFGVSAALLGIPDAGMTNLVEMEMVARRVCSALREGDLPEHEPPPLIVDGDTGYGGSANMRRTISALANAGAAAITIEDQVFPKKCTIAAGDKIRILDREAATQRVNAAIGARNLYDAKCSRSKSESLTNGPGVWIVARTDCRLAFGFQETIERCLRFEDMGADVVYAENLQSFDEYQKLRSKLDPKTITMVAQVQEGKDNVKKIDRENGKPLLTIQEIGDMGFDLALFGVTPLQCVVGSLQKAAGSFFDTGIVGQTTNDRDVTLAEFESLKNVVGFENLEAFESEFPC